MQLCDAIDRRKALSIMLAFPKHHASEALTPDFSCILKKE